jgi:hypothetical protein
MRGRATAWLSVLLAFSPTARAQPGRLPAPGNRAAASRLADAEAVRARLGLDRDYEGIASVESVKVAVLDYGFEGIDDGRAYLPASAVIVEHYDPALVVRFGLGDPAYRKGFEPGNRHGRLMAQIVWAVTGFRPGGPTFYLLNANGPTMLRRAVRYAIERKVDVILFCGSFEGGGNGNGRGPINQSVSEAVAAGILWVNAAGNYGGRVYNGPVRVLPEGYLRLRDGSDIASLRFRNRIDENTVTVTLTWNDYREQEDAGTDKDLDLDVENWAGRIVGKSEKVQVSGTSRATGGDTTRNPRERLVLAKLPASPVVPTDPDYCYRIRIRAKSGRFTMADRLRVLVTSSRDVYLPASGEAPRAAVEFLDATGQGELYPPADHPLVLTVGDRDPSSSLGPTADGRLKPDVVLDDSRAYFSDGDVTAGSSNAAAYVAGVVAVLRAAAPALRPTTLLWIARQGLAVPSSTTNDRIARLARSSPPGVRFWQTPSRARLVEWLRAGR